MENHGHQAEVGSLAAAETLAVVLQGSQVAVRIQVVLPLAARHDLEIPVVHLQGILLVEIRETLLEALVLPHPQPVHLAQQAILSQQVY